MVVEKRRIGQETLLVVEGVIKLGESAQLFVRTLERVLEEEAGGVLIDLAGINTIDSTGIGELVGYLGRFHAVERQLVLVRPSERIRRLLEVAQLDSLFPIHDDLESALAAARG